VVRGLSTAVRLVLAGVFLVSGAVKVLDPQLAVQAVRAYRLLPAPLEHTVGWGLPFLEIALGLLLATGLATRAAAVVSSGLLVVFIVAVASAALRGLSIDCGCFGGGGTVAPGETRYGAEVARDVVLLGMSLWLLLRPASFFSLDPQPDDHRHRLRPGRLEQQT
jgi:uncharacterized membrane protein YphA (DoxX/SURF4 family)